MKTVEEARAVLEDEMAGRNCGPMLDDLIRAVRAEMPCATGGPSRCVGEEGG